jgi:hypothetical protein
MVNSLSRNLLITILTLSLLTVFAQCSNAQTIKSRPRTDLRMIYHDGVVMRGLPAAYLIYYGDWPTNGSATSQILTEFLANIGSSPYLMINTTYPDGLDLAPSGGLIYGGAAVDRSYAHGTHLTPVDLEAIVDDQLLNARLPADLEAVYIIVTSPDIDADYTGFCSPGVAPFHSTADYQGATLEYVFIGNPTRCPEIAAPQYVVADGSLRPTPNGDFVGDAMVANLASALNSTITNPRGDGWFDRFGVESGEKCLNQFGQTYVTQNGAQANVRLGQRDFLLHENWVNSDIGYCAMAASR